MKILAKKLSIDEFKEYVEKKDFGSIPPNFLVIHHTWSPTEKQWDGEKTIQSLKKYYEGLGWSAGPHLFIADDGIWLFTDMYEVGIHANEGNATWKKKSNGVIWGGWGDDFVNNQLLEYSIGIEVVGNYDGKVWSGKTKENALEAIKILKERLNIPENRIMFHRDYSSKTCPGKSITKDWLIKQLHGEDICEPEEESAYVKNLRKIFGYVKNFLERDYGDNPNDNETKEIERALIEKDEEFKQYIDRINKIKEIVS